MLLLQDLNIGYCTLREGEKLDALRSMTNLTELNVTDLQFHDTIFRELGPSLDTLKAANSSLSDRACRWLTSCTWLDLSYTDITFADLKDLAKVCTCAPQLFCSNEAAAMHMTAITAWQSIDEGLSIQNQQSRR